MAAYCFLAAPFLEQSRSGRVPVHENPEECLHYGFSGKLDGPSETSVHPPDVEPGRPNKKMKLLPVEGGADELLAGLHHLRRGLGEQEPAEDLFQLPHVLDRRRRGARRKVLKLNLAGGGLHLASGADCQAQPLISIRIENAGPFPGAPLIRREGWLRKQLPQLGGRRGFRSSWI